MSWHQKPGPFRIGGKTIGNGEPCFVIAEAGVNHNGDLLLAEKLIDEACESGADAVKFQTFCAEGLVTRNAAKAEYQKKNDPVTGTQFEMLKKLELSDSDFNDLSAYARKKGIIFLSTAFDDQSLDLLIKLNMPAFKISSGEITNIPMIGKIAQQRKPVILSTGMSTLDEVRDAVKCIREHGCNNLVLLHCTTNYPAPIESVNLRVLETLRREFNALVGYSDHTKGLIISFAAVAMGACVIEKHFTLNKKLPGPDHRASLNPKELAQLIQGIRDIERAFGTGKKNPSPCELDNMALIRKSIIAKEEIPKNTIISQNQITVKRPGTGISPKETRIIIGSRALKTIKKGELLSWNDITLKNNGED